MDQEPSLAFQELPESKEREVSLVSWDSLVCLVDLEVLDSQAAKVFLETQEESDFPEVQVILGRKVREVTLVDLVCLESLAPRRSLRKENMETQASAVYQASPDPEVTKVSLVCLVVRVCLVCPVSRSRVKVFLESLVSLGSPGLQVSQDQRESPASTASQE